MVYPLINSPISYTSHLNEDLVLSVIMLPSTLANYSKNQLIKKLIYLISLINILISLNSNLELKINF